LEGVHRYDVYTSGFSPLKTFDMTNV